MVVRLQMVWVERLKNQKRKAWGDKENAGQQQIAQAVSWYSEGATHCFAHFLSSGVEMVGYGVQRLSAANHN